ncbi:MAG: TIGR01906 family membrane protein [Aristaeellaceae bacterium]
MKRVSSALSALLLCVAMLAAVVYGAGTSAGIMEALMRRTALPEETGLPAEQYAPMARMITAYLKGEGDFQLVYSVRDAEIVAFNTREQAHMADVQGLFRLAKWVLVLGGMALPLLGLSLRRMGRGLLRGIRKGLIVILALVGIVAIWAAVDFNRLFILFHRIAFTNDLWLLDPRTDLLIRLMPIEFFISYAALIGGLWLLGMIGLLILSTHCIKITKVE